MGRLLFTLASELLGFLFKGIVAKFFVFFALFYITTEFVPVVIEMFVPDNLIPNLNTLFNSIPDSIWFFLNLFKFPLALSLYVSAMLSRFIIRRIPFIG